MQEEAVDFPKAYRWSRLGFFLMALGLVPTCILEVAVLVGRFSEPRLLRWIARSGLLEITDTLVPWATLAGATLLWTAWELPSWRRRAGLLMTMCLVDVACWFVALGDPNGMGEHAFFRNQLGAALGWAQFALIASLSGDVLVHLGVEQAEESSKSTRSLAATGAVVWMLLFVETTDLQAGWPLQRAPAITLHARLLWLANTVIHTICLIQVSALVVAAFRRLNDVGRLEDEDPKALREMDDFDDYVGAALKDDRRSES
ncbi:hypothetical protein [Paludisphaera rhizosphaerae]|uniref:hypothetical protein n=1 Tax=Paludisphaera rhizosphaerae TaxID=2711216 RepID=UPI0013EAD1AF|nr:hypothetical protein [Paludisphaera rhizosphaerae]